MPIVLIGLKLSVSAANEFIAAIASVIKTARSRRGFVFIVGDFKI
jgi:hypothetical protein